jgi:hypothetical protein
MMGITALKKSVASRKLRKDGYEKYQTQKQHWQLLLGIKKIKNNIGDCCIQYECLPRI